MTQQLFLSILPNISMYYTYREKIDKNGFEKLCVFTLEMQPTKEVVFLQGTE